VIKNVTFAWSNYTKPTPKNLEFVFELLEDTLKFATAFSVWEEVDPWIPISILVFAFVCGKLKKFFATIALGEQEEVKITYPAEIAHQVEVTTETKSE
jgi:hypothetical protein